jgi:hypothetical protein
MGMQTFGYENRRMQFAAVDHNLVGGRPGIGLMFRKGVCWESGVLENAVSGRNRTMNINRIPKRMAVNQAGQTKDGTAANPPSKGPNRSPVEEISFVI